MALVITAECVERAGMAHKYYASACMNAIYRNVYYIRFVFGAHWRSTPSSPAIVLLFLAIGVHVVLTLANDGAASKPLQTPAIKPCTISHAAMGAQ